MSNWDKSDPMGLENINKGAERIRDVKQALQDALDDEHHFPNSLNMYHKWPYGNSVTGYAGRWRYNDTAGQIERYDTSWSAITLALNVMPSGTKMLFFQATAPTGWTQDAAFGDDEMLRVLGTGSIGSGGSWGTPSSSDGSHSHSLGSTAVSLAHTYATLAVRNFGANEWAVIALGDHNATHSHSMANSSHDHALANTWRPAYVDVIVAAKD